MAMCPDDIRKLLLVGRVGKTHGVRGELKVIPETDDPNRLTELDTLYVGTTPDAATAYTIESIRFQPSKRGITVILKLQGYDSMEAATALRGLHVYAHEDDLPPLADDEFYLHDLIGLDVMTDAGEPVGTVKDVMELPAQVTLIVARDGQPDVLIPAVPAFLDDIDFEASRLIIRPIEGLLE